MARRVEGEWMASELEAADAAACLRPQRALQRFIVAFFGSMFLVLVVLPRRASDLRAGAQARHCHSLKR